MYKCSNVLSVLFYLCCLYSCVVFVIHNPTSFGPFEYSCRLFVLLLFQNVIAVLSCRISVSKYYRGVVISYVRFKISWRNCHIINVSMFNVSEWYQLIYILHTTTQHTCFDIISSIPFWLSAKCSNPLIPYTSLGAFLLTSGDSSWTKVIS